MIVVITTMADGIAIMVNNMPHELLYFRVKGGT